MRFKGFCLIAFVCLLMMPASLVSAQRVDEPEVRMQWYQDFSYASGVPWYEIAAVDQFERNIFSFREECNFEYETISICIADEVWSGPENPNSYDDDEYSVSLFGGIAKDGDGDGIADIHNEEDVMYTMVEYLRSFDDFEEAIMSYYQDEKSVQIIKQIASLFKHYGTITLAERSFPVSIHYNYSYQDNYGAARGWGGRRSHEGVDVFAGYSTPVLSTAYGVIEIVGWNKYGGYRIGIRDIYNTYQYYAHLHGYEGEFKEGDIVEPGQVIGYVGSTGYGPEGTSGKFPPHLHFGLYKYDGRIEWAFNPHPHLIRWERESRNR